MSLRLARHRGKPTEPRARHRHERHRVANVVHRIAHRQRKPGKETQFRIFEKAGSPRKSRRRFRVLIPSHVLIFRPQGHRFARPRFRIRRIRQEAFGQSHGRGEKRFHIRQPRNTLELEGRSVHQPQAVRTENFLTGGLRLGAGIGIPVRDRFRFARRTRRVVRGKLRRFPRKPRSVRRRNLGQVVRDRVFERSGIRRRLRTDRFHKIEAAVPLRKPPFCL